MDEDVSGQVGGGWNWARDAIPTQAEMTRIGWLINRIRNDIPQLAGPNVPR